MTKTLLGLLLVAAAAAPLVHGCGDSSIECLGAPVACENRELEDCNGGCRVSEGCLGGTITCDSLTDVPTICLQTPGCRYVGSCEGADGCEELDFDACGGTPGCVVVRRCFGGSLTCASLERDLCELYAECRLGEECGGSAAPCNDLESTAQCLNVPGCFTADTEPSVVD